MFALVPRLGTCHEYRFFELLVLNDTVSYEEGEDPADLLAEIDVDGTILKSFAVVRNNSDEGLVLDRTFNIQFPEVIGPLNVQFPEAVRKVGLEIALTEGTGGKVKLEYKQSEIEKWIPVGGLDGVLVPSFRIFNVSGDLDFSRTDLVVRGVVVGEAPHRILIIQRVESDGAGNDVKLRRRKR